MFTFLFNSVKYNYDSLYTYIYIYNLNTVNFYNLYFTGDGAISPEEFHAKITEIVSECKQTET